MVTVSMFVCYSSSSLEESYRLNDHIDLRLGLGVYKPWAN
jgi:hypothetical protein